MTDKHKEPSEPPTETKESDKPKDAGPACAICGQPQEGHPMATDNAGIHDFVPPDAPATAEPGKDKDKTKKR